jgi:hypothetical protein
MKTDGSVYNGDVDVYYFGMEYMDCGVMLKSVIPWISV